MPSKRTLPDVAADASYDWHVLISAPFGMRLKESPVPLHEVLLFHDESIADNESENKECYALEPVPARFIGRRPDNYLWCFDHDRLVRIDASVPLALAEARQVFAQACAIWLKSSAAEALSDQTSAGRCDGRDGDISFSGRLAAATSGSPARLSVTLIDIGAADNPRPAGESPLPSGH